MRIGYRGMESGELSMDSKYTEYMNGATESGIKLGTYIYSQAISKEEMDEEIEFCLYAMKNTILHIRLEFSWIVQME